MPLGTLLALYLILERNKHEGEIPTSIWSLCSLQTDCNHCKRLDHQCKDCKALLRD